MRPLPSYHDLPPIWDGQPVEWGDWSDVRQTFICGRGSVAQFCACGAPDTARQSCTGRLDGLLALTVLRCPGCGCDVVVEHAERLEDAQVWDLEWPADYGDAGTDERPAPTLFDA